MYARYSTYFENFNGILSKHETRKEKILERAILFFCFFWLKNISPRWKYFFETETLPPDNLFLFQCFD